MFNFYSSGSVKKIAIAAIAIVIFGAFFVSSRLFIMDATPKSLSPEEILAKQEEELKKFREQALANPLTEEEIKRQEEELEKLREESRANPLSQEERDRQEEELKKLRTRTIIKNN